MKSEYKPGWFVHPAFASWALPFEEKYQMANFLMVGDPAFAKNRTRKREGRHCIFCDKSFPEVNFQNAALLLSKMIGNTDMYSTFECDTCNNKFSLLETDLSYFLGLGRSITEMNKDKKPPGFAGIGTEAKPIWYKGRKLLVIHKENAERKAEEGSTKLDYRKPTYTPANVYKLFLKCALSVLPQKDVINDYKMALQHLQGGKVLGGAHINLFRFPLTVNMPLYTFVFKRKPGIEKLPVNIVSFYFANLVVTLPVLLHQQDTKYFGQTMEVPAAPPYFVDGNDLASITPEFFWHDLSSPLKLKNEPEEITMQFNKADLENAARFDPVTGEVTEIAYNPSGSKYFIVTERGTEFTKEELAGLLKEIERQFSKESKVK
jgi:hypothetical protein